MQNILWSVENIHTLDPKHLFPSLKQGGVRIMQGAWFSFSGEAGQIWWEDGWS